MMGSESLPALLEAGQTVGLVLVQAIVLYIGYGALVQAAKPHFASVLGER